MPASVICQHSRRMPFQTSSPPSENDQVVAAVGPNVGFGAALLATPAGVEHVRRVHGLLGPAAGTGELLVDSHAAADSATGLAHDLIEGVSTSFTSGPLQRPQPPASLRVHPIEGLLTLECLALP